MAKNKRPPAKVVADAVALAASVLPPADSQTGESKPTKLSKATKASSTPSKARKPRKPRAAAAPVSSAAPAASTAVAPPTVPAEEIAAQSTGRRKYKAANCNGMKPYEPSARDLSWYLKWTRDGKGQQSIADEATPKVTRQTVFAVLKKVDAWARQQLFDEIVEVRSRHQQLLERIIEQALTQWQKDWEVDHAEIARKSLADIRKMLGADKPTTINVETELPRVAGMTPQQALQATAAALLASANELASHSLGDIANGLGGSDEMDDSDQ